MWPNFSFVFTPPPHHSHSAVHYFCLFFSIWKAKVVGMGWGENGGVTRGGNYPESVCLATFPLPVEMFI